MKRTLPGDALKYEGQSEFEALLSRSRQYPDIRACFFELRLEALSHQQRRDQWPVSNWNLFHGWLNAVPLFKDAVEELIPVPREKKDDGWCYWQRFSPVMQYSWNRLYDRHCNRVIRWEDEKRAKQARGWAKIRAWGW